MNRFCLRVTSAGALRLGLVVGLLGAGGCGSPSPTSRMRGSDAPAWSRAADQSARIPGGPTCVAWLRRLGIPHSELGPTRGVESPVKVTGPVGGIHYQVYGRDELTADCRLVLALDWIGPYLRHFGVARVRHSGAYSYRSTRSGRLSLHARGLAIDVHGFTLTGPELTVEESFAKGLEDHCSSSAPVLNRIECHLRGTGLFRELITPNHNADHRDHLHLAIAPL